MSKKIVALMTISLILLSELSRVESNAIKMRKGAKRHSNGHHQKHWGYRNFDKNILPKEWHKAHPKCHGEQQSPINIELSYTHYDPELKHIEIEQSEYIKYDEEDEKYDENEPHEMWSLKNNGHSVVLTPLNKIFKITLTPENEKYRLLQMHFHWRGSEHEVNGHKFAGELHLVHQHLDNSDKFAVLGFLFEISDDDNSKLTPIMTELEHVIEYNTTTKSHGLRLDDMLPIEIDRYFRYSGSLTTPGCDEIVQWVVVDTPVLTISEEQLLNFQSLQDKNGYPVIRKHAFKSSHYNFYLFLK